MQLRQLEAQLTTTSGDFSNLLKQAGDRGPADDKDKVGAVSDTTQMQAMLGRLGQATKQKTVAVYTIIGEARFSGVFDRDG